MAKLGKAQGVALQDFYTIHKCANPLSAHHPAQIEARTEDTRTLGAKHHRLGAFLRLVERQGDIGRHRGLSSRPWPTSLSRMAFRERSGRPLEITASELAKLLEAAKN